MAVIFDTLKNYANCKQKEKELLLDHVQRFKLSWEVLALCMDGSFLLNKRVEENHAVEPA